MIDINQIYWAAGFIDGEGSFGIVKNCPRIVVGQVEVELLNKLKTLLGGIIRIEKRQYKGNAHDINLWQLNGKHAVGVMLTLYALLSTKRKNRIVEIINAWKHQSRLRNPMFWKQSVCKRGHDLMVGSPNVRIDSNGRRTCWICIRANWRRQYNRKSLQLAA